MLISGLEVSHSPTFTLSFVFNTWAEKRANVLCGLLSLFILKLALLIELGRDNARPSPELGKLLNWLWSEA